MKDRENLTALQVNLRMILKWMLTKKEWGPELDSSSSREETRQNSCEYDNRS